MGGDTPTPARLTSLTSCPLQHPQSAVLEGCEPGGQPAGPVWHEPQGCFSVASPRHAEGYPLGARCNLARRGGALAWLSPLLGRSQGHCRVTQRAYPTWLSLPAPAETWHARCRPASSRGCARQPARQPPRDAAAHGPCQPPAPSVSLPLWDRGTAEPRPRVQAGTALHGGHRHAATCAASWWRAGGAGFQVPPRCHGAEVAAGAWHGPEPPPGAGCVAWPRCQAPSLALRPGSPWGKIGWGGGVGGGPGINPAGIGTGQGTPLFPAPHLHLPWLCPCARSLADPVPCRATLCHRSVGGQRDPCAQPVPAPCCRAVNRWSQGRSRRCRGGSALPLVPLPGERPFASQVPGVASLSAIKQTLPRSGARCCPCARGTSTPLLWVPPNARCPPRMLGCGGHAGHGGEEPPKSRPQAPLAVVVL